MFNDEFLEKIFGKEEMQKIPIGTQATSVSVFEQVLKEVMEENQYAAISDLFADE